VNTSVEEAAPAKEEEKKEEHEGEDEVSWSINSILGSIQA
jgi:hypothetical protein